jgi:acyloxyacyl hydrolase
MKWVPHLILFFCICWLETTYNEARITHSDKTLIRQSLSKLTHQLLGFPAEIQAGGALCVECVIVVSVIEQMTVVHEKSVEEVMDLLCEYLPKVMQPWCLDLINDYGDLIIQLLERAEPPDIVCLQLKLCVNASCRLYHYDHIPREHPIPKSAYRRPKIDTTQLDWNPLQWIIDQIQKTVGNHLPFYDLDHDRFSIIETLRGTKWRGRDCDDSRSDIYPGRLQTNYPPNVDHDCNGIYGVNPNTGKPWEDELCARTQPMGAAILGDSAGAHFHIPPEWMTAKLINKTTYINMLNIVANELDWPQMSAATGYEETHWIGVPFGPVHSFYHKLRKRNLCMHRDYQNIAVNGARSGSMANEIVKTLARNATYDKPLLMSYALIGNDVCSPHPGTGWMTTPQEFYTNVMNALNYLDNGVLPRGSHLIFVGLADGRLLYEGLHNRTHPLGELRHDVTYSDVYQFLTCLGVNPCWGWLNTDPYWRDQTTFRAFELNAVLVNITRNYKPKNFDLTYFDSPINAVMAIWLKMGGKPWQLIEPVDGFHPSQIGNWLTANYMWDVIEKNYTHLLPPINPHNDVITKIFGNQGGY